MGRFVLIELSRHELLLEARVWHAGQPGETVSVVTTANSRIRCEADCHRSTPRWRLRKANDNFLLHFFLKKIHSHEKTGRQNGDPSLYFVKLSAQLRLHPGHPPAHPLHGDVEVRGECVASWAGFDEVNKHVDEPYAHPRGLAAGSVRLLNQRESAPRELQFVAFELVQPFLSTVENSYAFLAEQGFSVVPHLLTKTPGQVIR